MGPPLLIIRRVITQTAKSLANTPINSRRLDLAMAKPNNFALLLLLLFLTSHTEANYSSRYSSRLPPMNPVVCASITSGLIGMAIGIGIGALIWDRPWKHGNVGGGIWFGRRRRSIIEDDDEADEVLNKIDRARQKYNT